MNIEHKTRALALVNELRSGRWEQATQYLRRNENSGCCLGVGCALAVKLGAHIGESMREIHQVVDDLGYTLCNVYEYDGEMHYLPDSAQDWYGFAEHKGDFAWLDDDPIRDQLTGNQRESSVGLDGLPSLAGLNDAGASFELIADLIEDEALHGNRRGLFA